MPFCRNKQLTRVQRRSMAMVGAMCALTASLNLMTRQAAEHLRSPVSVAVLAVLACLPTVGLIAVAARYLREETDEFIRNLIIQSMLWGFAVTMVGTALFSVLLDYHSRSFSVAVLNTDLFLVGTGFAFRILQWRHR